MTALRYHNEVLCAIVRPYAGVVGERFILMPDDSLSGFITDVGGKLYDKIDINTDCMLFRYTVVNGKLWVRFASGDIIVTTVII